MGNMLFAASVRASAEPGKGQKGNRQIPSQRKIIPTHRGDFQ